MPTDGRANLDRATLKMPGLDARERFVMPISLPPPVVPQQIEAEAIHAAAPSASAMLGDVRIQLFGPTLPHDLALGDVVSPAKMLSDAVYAIRDMYYANGYPAVLVYYSLDGNDLDVLVYLAGVSSVEVPAAYRPYFSRLLSPLPLTASSLEPVRALASVHADRAGDTGQLAFKQQQDGSTSLMLSPTHSWSDRASAVLAVGNPGNRYIGRYFADFSARAGFESGTEVSMGLRHALTGIDSENPDNAYREWSLGWSGVSPEGLWGINAYHADYRQQAPTTRGDTVAVQGGITQLEMGLQQIVMANFDYRWSLGARFIYTNKYLDLRQGNSLLQRQEYGSAELSSGYGADWSAFGLPLKIDGQIALQRGLGPDDTDDPSVLADLGYNMATANLTLGTRWGAHTDVTIAASGQISDSSLPEQRQWLLGGQYNIEAYLPGEAIGDSGWLARLAVDRSIGAGALRFVPGVFVEFGAASLKTRLSEQYAGETALSDAGAALKLAWRKWIDARVSYALPLDGENSDAKLLFRMSGVF